MKCLLKLVALFALLALLAVGALVAFVDPLIETAVTESVQFTTRQDTTLEAVDLGLLSGEFTMEGLRIENPPGFQETPLFELGRFHTALGSSGLTAEVIELDEVELDGLALALEVRGTETNVTQLVERLRELQEELGRQRRGGGGEGPGEPTEPGEPPSPEAGPALKINRIRIAGVEGSLRITDVPMAEGVYALEMPDIVLEDFSSDMDGATAAEWTAYALEEVITQSLAAADGPEMPAELQAFLRSQVFTDDVLKNLMSGDTGSIGDALEARAGQELEELLGDAERDPEGTLQKLREDAEKSQKALDDIFGGGGD